MITTPIDFMYYKKKMLGTLDVYDRSWYLKENEVYQLLEEYASIRIEEYKQINLIESEEDNKLII